MSDLKEPDARYEDPNKLPHLNFFLDASDEQLAEKLEHVPAHLDGPGVGWPGRQPFEWFHQKCIRTVLKDGDRYLGMRAEHFLLIYGWSESKELSGDCVVVLSNHKGRMNTNIYRFVDKEPARPQGGQSGEQARKRRRKEKRKR
ncbi:MAG: hypothetical protein LBP95_10110 [Deltaproteobacteria bacterium]|nr:hypothetical protein [Deltaproteobacteria bacterium]